MPVTDLFYYRLDGAPTIYSTNKKNKNKNCKLIYLQLISLNIIFVIKSLKKFGQPFSVWGMATHYETIWLVHVLI